MVLKIPNGNPSLFRGILGCRRVLLVSAVSAALEPERVVRCLLCLKVESPVVDELRYFSSFGGGFGGVGSSCVEEDVT
jgi:hypothetical protein